MEMSDLPMDLVEEILSKLPVTCMRAVRLTCKKWNTLSKNQSFVEKHIGEETTSKRECSVIMMMDYKVYLMGVNLSKADPSIEHKGKLIMRYNNTTTDSVKISTVLQSDGLLLFVMNIYKKGLAVSVWNPYCGQHKWIQPITYANWGTYAIGYDEKKDKSRSHKILRMLNVNIGPYEMYDLKSDSWKVLAINTTLNGGDICLCQNALSLMGNTYWVATEELERRPMRKKFLICFDFTNERLGPRLSLPFDSYLGQDTVILSSVREEHIAVLFKRWGRFETEIWVTSKITPETVSWSKFLAVDMKPFITYYQVINHCRGFFVDVEKKLVVVFGKDEDGRNRNVAYINGVDGYFRKVYLGEAKITYYWPFLCSYVLSSVHINHPIC